MKLFTLIIGVVVLPCISAIKMSIDALGIGHEHALPATPANTNTNTNTNTNGNGNNQNNGNGGHINDDD